MYVYKFHFFINYLYKTLSADVCHRRLRILKLMSIWDYHQSTLQTSLNLSMTNSALYNNARQQSDGQSVRSLLLIRANCARNDWNEPCPRFLRTTAYNQTGEFKRTICRFSGISLAVPFVCPIKLAMIRGDKSRDLLIGKLGARMKKQRKRDTESCEMAKWCLNNSRHDSII